jgi:hypothetical protein
MQIPVLIEPVAGNGYRALAPGLGPLSAEGSTAVEAVEKLRELLASRIAQGSRVVTIEVPGDGNPWAQMAGVYRNEPMFDEWRQAMAEYRQKIEDDPDCP